MERRIYALLLRYDGGPYKGWQPHPQLPTVGGVLSAAMHRAGIGATPYGASRTDAGVHARAQVASFHSRADLDLEGLPRALNDDLPDTIRVVALRQASKSFHSHWSSCGKVYRYRVSFTGESRAWRLPAPGLPYSAVDEARLALALARLAAAPDVGALSLEREPKPRRLAAARIVESEPRGLTLEFAAAGFGKYLVRHLVSAALGAAVGSLSLEELDAVARGDAPRPIRADPDGLVLHRVLYPPKLDPFPDLELLLR